MNGEEKRTINKPHPVVVGFSAPAALRMIFVWWLTEQPVAAQSATTRKKASRSIPSVSGQLVIGAVLKDAASLLPPNEAKVVYPEGGIKDVAGTHRTRDEGMNLLLLIDFISITSQA